MGPLPGCFCLFCFFPGCDTSHSEFSTRISAHRFLLLETVLVANIDPKIGGNFSSPELSLTLLCGSSVTPCLRSSRAKHWRRVLRAHSRREARCVAATKPEMSQWWAWPKFTGMLGSIRIVCVVRIRLSSRRCDVFVVRSFVVAILSKCQG